MSERVAHPVWRRPMLIAAVYALVALAVGLAVSPKSVMQGWLIAFVFVKIFGAAAPGQEEGR